MTVDGVKQNYLYDPASHRLTTPDGKARGYDAAGNTIAIGDATLVPDAAGHLGSVTGQGRSLVTYGYDAADQRIVRTEMRGAKTGLILYDEAGRWLADYDTAGKVTRQAVWMDDYLVGLVDNGELLYVEPDHLGSPRAVIDPVSKVTLWRWRPSDDPFGTAPPEEDPDADGARFVFDLRFPGQRYDALTGLYYNYLRDYDAATGRYIQVDPIGLAGGINPYLYAGASPLKYIDPDGQFFFVPALIGAAIGAASDIAFQLLVNGGRVGCISWKQAGVSAGLGAIGGGLGSVTRLARGAKEFSHWIPTRYFSPVTRSGKNLNPSYKRALDLPVSRNFVRSTMNGNYVSARTHALTDPYRHVRGMKASDKLNPVLKHAIRAPAWLTGSSAGAGAGVANSALGDSCGCN